MFNVNYTFSRSLDTYSDENKFQVEHNQTRPFLNRGLFGFPSQTPPDHELDLGPAVQGNRLVSGWQISGVGTFQPGRPFSVVDDDFSGFLFGSTGQAEHRARRDT